VLPGGGDPRIGAAIDPAAGGGDACATTAADDQPGTATYRLPPARAEGYTLLGAPTVIADLGLVGDRDTAQIALRLWDVAPGGSSQTLVGRGSYRPSGQGTEVFQVHPNGYRFEPGHIAKLELLGNDAPYGRPSNAPFRVEVERLELRLPVRDEPDCRTVLPAAAPVLPAGHELAPGVSAPAAGCGEPPTRRTERTDGRPFGPDRDRRFSRDDQEVGNPGSERVRADTGDGLPFTGLDLALLAGSGALLMVLGLALRGERRSRSRRA